MCGISGFFLFKDLKDFNFEKLKKITNTINHRGPDSRGFWYSKQDRIYLGHTRLSILDLSDRGSQPMTSSCGRFVISFNGEIYNFKKISQKLKKEFNIEFANGTDTIVLLEAISRYGLSEALKKIEGMFAFVIWDKKEKKVFLARDRFGEKPLFYYRDKDLIIFGSELKVIKSAYNLNLKISRKASYYYSMLGYIPAPLSIYENVFKVMPSETIEICKYNKIFKKKYFSLNLDNKNEELNFFEFKEKISNSLEDSVKKMMIADVEVGCFLSGGVDSSLIAYLMQKNSKKKIKTFTVGFQEKQYDETSYAKSISEQIGSNHFELKINSSDLFENIESLVEMFDEPFSDSSFIPTFLISKFASKKVKVVLSGDGGDEIFMGYNRYVFAKKIFKIRKIFPNFFRLFLSNFLDIIPKNFFDSLSVPFQKTFGIHGLSHKVQKFSNTLNFNNNSDFYLKLNVFDNEIIKKRSKYEKQIFKNFEKIPLTESVQANDINFYLQNDILVKVDRSSMINSLEVRSPFLDHNLVDQAFTIPSSFKLKNNYSKFILKDLLNDFSPQCKPFRPKMGFAIPIEKWIEEKKIKKKINEIFFESDWNRLGYDNHEIKKKWKNFTKFKTLTPQCIWMYTVAGMWLNKN